ncbi:hypothetical protein C8R43DRAFT_879377 [Mycena crocata]|nr:hypothetical protein C8R43DRAFT_879377 [Mycena crocata]
MIHTALKYCRAYREFTTDESNGLQAFVLTSAEWTVIEDLCDILCVLFFSRGSATLASVIPAMDKIDSLLATAVLKKPTGDKKFCIPMKAALLKAKKTLNRYYSLAFHSRIYRITLILHPRYKIGYLRDNDWEADDTALAKEELQEVFDVYKEAHDAVVIMEVDEEEMVDVPMVRSS